MTVPKSTKARPVRAKDRAATESRILAAARRLIGRDGFAGFGLNALAAEAGCDKVLIRRYFGDLDGVLTALGGDVGFWIGDPDVVAPEGGYGARMAGLFEAYADALAADPVLQRVLSWELVEASVPLRRLDEARGRAMGTWMQAAKGDAVAPPGLDAPAINAVLLAALHYLTLRTRTLEGFAGLDLATPEGQARIRAAFRWLFARAYAEPTGGEPDA
ncbi:MAG: TetR/AcrR family transcriptional regulator [Pseudomonadota bacterium]